MTSYVSKKAQRAEKGFHHGVTTGLIIILAIGVGAVAYIRQEYKKQEDRRQLLRRLMDI